MKKQIEKHLKEHFTVYLDLLQKMVAINSYTANPAGVNQLGNFTAETFAPLGFQAKRTQSENSGYGKHLTLIRPGNSTTKIGLIAHLDTVFPPEEEKANDFSFRIEGDRIYGPGTNDIKGGTVIIYMILDALRAAAPQVFNEITWVLLFNAAEERNSDDFSQLCLKSLGDDALAALVFEAGVRKKDEFQLVTARKGMANYRITAEGKASHAGGEHKSGANAILQLTHTVQQIAALTDYERDLTFNIGRISGGVVTNRVPHHAEAKGEMRAFTSEVFESGVEAMLALQEKTPVTSPDGKYPCRVKIDLVQQTAPWPRNPKTESLLQIWQEIAPSLGLRVIREERGGLSDGNFLWAHIPTIDGLGPYGANAHCSERSEDGSKNQEFANKSSFVPKALLNTMAILKLIDEG